MRRVGVIVAAVALGVLIALLAPARGAAQQPPHLHDGGILTFVSFDELEYLPGVDHKPIEVDALAWVGGDVARVAVKLRGEQSTREHEGEWEGQLLYGRAVAPFWDVQAGVRVDTHRGRDETRARGLLALGLQGLAPYWFEVESALFLSQDGDLSARLEASYDLLITQRLIVEPEAELNVAAQDVPDFGVGAGLTTIELGGRLRYEIVRELAPYVGVHWLRRLGNTADLARAGGAATAQTSLVIGLRWWY